METKQVAFRSVCIAFAIVKKDNKYLCTHETNGWYLPAGRVDYGETFTTGAIREALEETDVPIKLEGILRLEHSPDTSVRLRCFFLASPIGDTPPLSIPNHEIIEAKWLTLDEIRKIPPEKLRSLEILENVDRGIYQAHPLSVLDGLDSQDINHKQAITNMIYKCNVIIRSQNKLCFTKQENMWKIPSKIMETPRLFNNFAKVTPVGITKISHVPCESMTVTFVAEVKEMESNPDYVKWLTLEEYEKLEGHSEVELALLKDLPNVYIAPLGLIALEGR